MPIDIVNEIATRFRLRPEQVRGSLEQLDAGNSPVFVAHYRREATGGLDEEAIRRVAALRAELQALETRRVALVQAADEAGLLTADLAATLETCCQSQLIDDLALAVRPARNTAAAKAADRGLAPLADAILQSTSTTSPEALASDYIQHNREVHTAEGALTGAAHIIAERYSVRPELRQRVRDLFWSDGVLRCSRGTLPDDQVKEFRDYFAFKESLRDLPPHRVLAVNRGERKKALKAVIDLPQELLLSECAALVIPAEHPWRDFLMTCLKDALDRLVLPAINREVRHDLTTRAQEHAIDVFANNVRGILMTPPVPGKRVLALDPGFRTGCKAAALAADGSLLGETIVYPHEPQRRWNEAKVTLLAAIRQHAVELIAVGNGTGCHETEKLVSEIIADNALDVEYTLVSEAGASAYAAGALAAEEFPRLDPALRGTVSVGRRLQDPLSEFVKVDPRVIGVGLYQHDIDQRLLKERLDTVTQRCVNSVGVDVNRANVALLENVAGLTPALARAIIAYRHQHGPLRSREQLRSVPGIDDHIFRQCAGFLRVYGGDNPLDGTAIHPESYATATALLQRFGYSAADLLADGGPPGLRQKLEKQSLEQLSRELAVGIPTLSHLLHCLEHPRYDPRAENPPPIFKKQMIRFEDLTSGMWLKGAVRNVVDFGAFVDVGVNEDGLVHVSQFSRKYIKNPVDFIHVGQTVDVRVLSIDKDRRRIALSMIPEDTPPAVSPSSVSPVPLQ
jgi:uncharacterized protein